MDWTLIRDLGFPAFVTAWFMFRTEGILTKLTQATDDLRVAVLSKK